MTETIFALRIVNDDMRPRLKKDEVVIYDTVATAQAGDDVLVIRIDGGAVIRELVGLDTDRYQFKRINSHVETAVPRTKVTGVYPIVAIARPAFWAEIVERHDAAARSIEGIQLENS